MTQYRHELTTTAASPSLLPAAGQTSTFRRRRRARQLSVLTLAVGPSFWLMLLLIPPSIAVQRLIWPAQSVDFWLAIGLPCLLAAVYFAGFVFPPVFNEFLAPDEIQHEEPAPIERAAPEPPPLLVNNQPIVRRRPSKTIEFGTSRLTFSGRNLDRLAQWYKAGHTQVRRESSPAGPGFNELPDPIISGRYSQALYALQGRGLINEQKEWTAAGQAFLLEE